MILVDFGDVIACGLVWGLAIMFGGRWSGCNPVSSVLYIFCGFSSSLYLEITSARLSKYLFTVWLLLFLISLDSEKQVCLSTALRNHTANCCLTLYLFSFYPGQNLIHRLYVAAEYCYIHKLTEPLSLHALLQYLLLHGLI